MAKTYFGLRGRGLATFMFWTTTCPVYLLFGWNNGVAGGLLDLPAWIKTFPEIDTLTTTGAQQAHNSTLQGTSSLRTTVKSDVDLVRQIC